MGNDESQVKGEVTVTGKIAGEIAREDTGKVKGNITSKVKGKIAGEVEGKIELKVESKVASEGASEFTDAFKVVSTRVGTGEVSSSVAGAGEDKGEGEIDTTCGCRAHGLISGGGGFARRLAQQSRHRRTFLRIGRQALDKQSEKLRRVWQLRCRQEEHFAIARVCVLVDESR